MTTDELGIPDDPRMKWPITPLLVVLCFVVIVHALLAH